MEHKLFEDDAIKNVAEWLIEAYTTRLRSHKLYKNAEATVSLLTITSNVAYSKQTGNSPVHKGVYLNEDGSVNCPLVIDADAINILGNCCSHAR